MRVLREWWVRLVSIIWPGRSDADIEEELRAHLAMAADEGRATLRESRLRAGGVDQAMEQMRDQRGVRWIHDLGRDLREATRLFTRTPAMAAVAVLSLGVALALGLTVVRVLNAYVLRGLPYPEADRLYTLTIEQPGQSIVDDAASLPWASLDDVVEHHIAWNLDMVALLGGEYPDAATAAWVTPGFVDGLGVAVALGRTLRAADFTPAGPIPVLISHRLWTSRFGASPDVLGRSLPAYSIEQPDVQDTFTVVGVLPPDFWHINTYTDVIGPLREPWFPYMLRLRPGVDAGVVAQRIDAMVRAATPLVPADWRPALISTHARYVASLEPVLAAMGGVAVIVGLIACANVGVLLLVRAVRRQHEMALRLALGASRARLARLLAAEAALLTGVATAVGLTLAAAALRLAAPAMETHLGRRVPGGVSALAVDGTVAWVTLAVVAVVALVLTAVPLAAATVPALRVGLVHAGRGATASRSARRLRGALVAAEIAGALALLVGATLMVESARRVLDDPVGLRGDVMAADIGLRERDALDSAGRAAAFSRMAGQVRMRVGHRFVALGGRFPLQPTPTRLVGSVDGAIRSAGASVLPVSAEYFETVGVALRDGATFAADDRPGGDPVAVVSESLAARLWPAQRAVGQWVDVPTDTAPDAPRVRHRVVGVVGDVQELRDEAGVGTDADRLDLYVPLLQAPQRFAFLYVRSLRAGTTTDVGATIRAAVATVDPEAAVSSVRDLGELIDAVRGRPRRLAWLLSVLALSAVLLALVGVYGVLAYTVRHRQREIGVRLALGATPGQVTGLFVREGAWLLASGLVVGAFGAVAIGRALESQLFGVAPVELRVIAAALAALACCGALASWWPARRAAQVAPAEVLRCE